MAVAEGERLLPGEVVDEAVGVGGGVAGDRAWGAAGALLRGGREAEEARGAVERGARQRRGTPCRSPGRTRGSRTRGHLRDGAAHPGGVAQLAARSTTGTSSSPSAATTAAARRRRAARRTAPGSWPAAARGQGRRQRRRRRRRRLLLLLPSPSRSACWHPARSRCTPWLYLYVWSSRFLQCRVCV